MAFLRSVLAVALLVASAACGGNQQQGDDPRPAREVRVEVANNNRRDLAVFSVRSGTRARIGTAVAGTTSRLTVRNLPEGPLTDFRLMVEVVGSADQFTSERILVNPGQTVFLEVADLLSTSRVSVR